MNFEENIAKLKEQSFELDCLEMTLTQSTPKNPIKFHGKGYIRQSKDDRLVFKLYATDSINTDALMHARSVLSAKSGKLYADDEYYTLEVKASDRREWRAERILPSAAWDFEQPNPIISGAIASLKTESKLHQPRNFLRMHFFGDAEIANLNNIFEFEACQMHFSGKKGIDQFYIEAKSESEINEHFYIKIQEALSFILAKSLDQRVLIYQRENSFQFTISSSFISSSRTRLYPPISSATENYFIHTWSLFSRYLEYIHKNTSGPYLNHCSNHLHNAREASANSLDAWSIGICLAIEGIAGLIKGEHSNEDKELLNKLRDFVIEKIKSNTQLKEFAARIQGLLGQLFNVSVPQRLKPLAEQHFVDPNHIRAWQNLRNKHAHPTQIDVEKLSEQEFQKTIDQIHQVTVLMYQLIFHLIGYSGKYTDYSAENFPSREYSLADEPKKINAPTPASRRPVPPASTETSVRP